jgi:hypothetical protein
MRYDRPTFRDQLKQIVGKKLEPLFLENLERVIRGLVLLIKQEFPTRGDAKDRLGKTAKAAAIVRQAIANRAILGLLESEKGKSGRDIDWGRLQFDLEEIERRASILHEDGDERLTGQGRHGINLPGQITAKEYCGIVTLEAWRIVHGRNPSPKNEDVNFLATTLWEAAGGQEIGKGQGDWGRTLKRVLRSEHLQPAREWVHSQLLLKEPEFVRSGPPQENIDLRNEEILERDEDGVEILKRTERSDSNSPK